MAKKKNKKSNLKNQKHQTKVKNRSHWLASAFNLALGLFNFFKSFFIGIKGACIK